MSFDYLLPKVTPHGFDNRASCICGLRGKDFCEGAEQMDRTKACTRCITSKNYENLGFRPAYDAMRRRFVCLKCHHSWSTQATMGIIPYPPYEAVVNKYKRNKSTLKDYEFRSSLSPADGPCSLWMTSEQTMNPNCPYRCPKGSVREVGPTLRVPPLKRQKEWKKLVAFLEPLTNHQSVVAFEYHPSRRNQDKKPKTNNYLTPEYFESAYAVHEMQTRIAHGL